MSIENRRQLENTRTKLQELEQLCAITEQATAADEHVRELTLRSLKKRMNRFREEIARFEARVSQTNGQNESSRQRPEQPKEAHEAES